MATTQAAKKRSLPYAHLLGGLMGRVTGSKAEEPKKENQDDEENLEDSDTDAKGKSAKAEGDDDEKKGPDDAGAASADDGDDGDDGDDDEKKKDDDEPAGKRAKKAKADDDDSEESAAARRAGYRAGRSVERARCAAIFNSAAAGARPDLAANLAFNTGMSSANAIAMLETTVHGTAALTPITSARSGLGARMEQSPIPNVGAGGGGAPSLVQQIVAANNKRLGIEPKK